ncbi:TPP-dependent pyruvate/acetoin dehydrogenase alpha subunit [Anoxybacillus voinovskiensis]|uniref:TPP-dependent pyruvate/acetoin dehydrogenase alpha subunit n=1 Tax=Anoxybacteroides voinovskiense TaxID=230470 RepID=A0A840DVS3_9BACL|nr:hypothetical protein [Anoxybacillus voinovskiensis]MBB4074527.1 TPP-dependent pyruvate/acetoin dehydrogenase alpha subunit [Anoxybacillus voinovskiensis]GGJ71367.1 hypothetical protein GCM10008982_20880 [Anoxybacillus voinovskiensis]
MKKFISGLLVFVSAIGLATAVFAASDSNSWGKMLPLMKQMHPNFSEEQLQKMYEQCRNTKNMDQMMEHMMNNGKMNQQMKQGYMM